MVKRLMLSVLALLALAGTAMAQNSGQTPGGATVPGATNFCFTGVTAADGSQIAVPCNASNPLPVVVTNGTAPPGATGTGPGGGNTAAASGPINVQVTGTVNTSLCPANPISRKIPPLC